MLRFTDFRLDASAIQQLPDGSIKVVGQLTRPGIFVYRNLDGTARREYRPPSEVFSKESLSSFASSTVTLNHPAGRKVTAATWKSNAIGNLGENVREDAGHAVSDVYVRDGEAVKNVLSGNAKFLSCGYRVDYDPTPGVTPEGEAYDGVQRNIRGNHVALLLGKQPRGGADCSLRLDSAGDEISAPLNSNVDETLNAQVIALTAELAKARTDSAEVPNLTAALAKANADLAVALAQVSPERLDALVEERTAIVATAKAAGVDTAGKSTLAIKRAIVAKRTPDLAARVDSLGAETVDTILAVYTSQPHPSMAAVVAAPVAGDRVDADATPKYTDLYTKHLTASQGAWKNSGDLQVSK